MGQNISKSRPEQTSTYEVLQPSRIPFKMTNSLRRHNVKTLESPASPVTEATYLHMEGRSPQVNYNHFSGQELKEDSRMMSFDFSISSDNRSRVSVSQNTEEFFDSEDESGDDSDEEEVEVRWSLCQYIKNCCCRRQQCHVADKLRQSVYTCSSAELR
mmetsp:Transcript_22867/g.33179  ORF Transcript_22867/g.33179 Transcript_22867/m.33179 type:complete len:158 (-) Transcript_22867:92-565(-)